MRTRFTGRRWIQNTWSLRQGMSTVTLTRTYTYNGYHRGWDCYLYLTAVVGDIEVEEEIDFARAVEVRREMELTGSVSRSQHTA